MWFFQSEICGFSKHHAILWCCLVYQSCLFCGKE